VTSCDYRVEALANVPVTGEHAGQWTGGLRILTAFWGKGIEMVLALGCATMIEVGRHDGRFYAVLLMIFVGTLRGLLDLGTTLSTILSLQ
jgi:hypothetical protein